MKSLLFIALFLLNSLSIEKEYIKKHHVNGQLIEEGWIINDKKSGYWFYYFENGIKKEEGHFSNNQKTNWWIYYDNQQKITRKCEYKNGLLNGLTLIYKQSKIVLVEKYLMGKKIKSWNQLSSFKKDNP
jgi:antitoxin component YwqK of YwqJK toxin-antitoxin module